MHSLKQLAGQTAVYGLSSIIGRFLNYLLTPLYTYQFLARDYGVVTEMYAYVAFLVVLLTYGMETSFFRFVNKSDRPAEVYNTALVPVITTGTIFAALCIIFADRLSGLIQYPDNPEFVVWFAIIVSLDAISSIPLARLRHEKKAVKFAWINLSSIGVNIGLNLFFIAYCKVNYESENTNALIDWCYSPEIGVGYIFIANLISSSIKSILLLPYYSKFKFKLDPVLFKRMLLYAAPLLVAGLAGIANENIDRLLLKYLLVAEHGMEYTMTQVGIYGACYKVSILITLFIQAYRYAAEPFFFSKSDDQDARQLYADMLRYFVMACLLIFLFLMLNIDWVMLFVGEEYRVGAEVVPILLMANIFLGIYYNLSVWYKLTDKTIYGAYMAIVGAGVTVALNIILIPRVGYIGSAWATFSCYFTMASISYILGRKNYAVPYKTGRIIVYIAVTIALYAIMKEIGSFLPMKILFSNLLVVLLALTFFILERHKKIII